MNLTLEHRPRDRLFLFVGRTNHDSSVSFIGCFSAFFAKLFIACEGFCLCLHLSLKLGSTFTICQQSFSFQFCPFLEERKKVGTLWSLNTVCFLCHTVPAVRQRSFFFFPSDGHKPFYIRSFQVTICH